MTTNDGNSRSPKAIMARLLSRQPSEYETASPSPSPYFSSVSPRVAKMFEILELRANFPQKLRKDMDEALDGAAGNFLFHLESSVADLLYASANTSNNHSQEDQPQIGLNSDVDTENQVETAIRCFPNVICRRSSTISRSEYNAPIEAQITLQSVAFLPLLARLGIELGDGTTFATEQRGGLVPPKATWCLDNQGSSPFDGLNYHLRHPDSRHQLRNNQTSTNSLVRLLAPHLSRCTNRHSSCNVLFELATTTTELHDPELSERIDKAFLAVIQKLRAENLFFQHDICGSSKSIYNRNNTHSDWNMVTTLCATNPWIPFPKQRFSYLVNWHPCSLLTPNHQGWLPIHVVANAGCCREEENGGNYGSEYLSEASSNPHSCLDRFRIVLAAGMTNFPTELGGLFHTNKGGDSAFRLACQNFGSASVYALIDNIMFEQEVRQKQSNTASTTQIILRTLVSLGSQEVVDMDGLYFWLRREPATMKLSSCTQSSRKKKRNSC
ncbi:unnamed protein product [Pseudo-nitzschia multistriata]|uniref:Uncharacterized protein n=1 Tax=Pseudo-nitzschia multistriata TaxID=183589 RepID=A0A448Z1E2_9STRA|nr:unnamed protein product [Pseudo-nitzschia multistriata]